MNRRPIQSLEIEESIRQRHAREASTFRYAFFFALTTTAWWVIWNAQLVQNAWILYTLVPTSLLPLLRPWHRSLHVDLDSPYLRSRVEAFGIVPVAQAEHALQGHRLTVVRRVQNVDESSSGLGCLWMLLPFPFSLLASLGEGSKDSSGVRVEWILCLKDSSSDTGVDLLRISDPHVATPFLMSMRDILPDHVELP